MEKIKIVTYRLSYPDIVNWSVAFCCHKSNAHLLVSVTLLRFLLNFPTLVVWRSHLLALLHYHHLI